MFFFTFIKCTNIYLRNIFIILLLCYCMHILCVIWSQFDLCIKIQLAFSSHILSFRTLAQVTQWGLILHGTEEPAQPNDPKSFDFPQPDANLFGEIDQNLDFDQTETGQWRTLHQVN